MRQDREIQARAKDFVFLRMTRMNGVDLNRFVFDYDLTFMAFFLAPDGQVLSRYGGRDADSAEHRLSARGLLNAMSEVLRLHESEGAPPSPPAPPPSTPEDIPAMAALTKGHTEACIHCHMVNDARYEQQRRDGTFRKASLWRYPLPENLGLSLDLDENNLVRKVHKGSPADRAGVRAGDRLHSARGIRTLTAADLQFALDGVGNDSKLALTVEREGKPTSVTLELPEGWRHQDLSWRKSIRELPPHGGFYGVPLAEDERAKQGIRGDHIAFRVQYVHPPSTAARAGLRAGDVIVAVDGKRQLPYRQLRSYFPLEHEAGDRVEVVVLRGGKEETVTFKLE